AARFYAKRHTANAPVRTVKEVCDEMIKAKKADGLSRRHTKDLQNRCNHWRKSCFDPACRSES
ncbi:MAG TPA: hypothetical protein VMQ67_06980, partial [Candidatus Saccharimonadales bacterium]|nr:hypothetical protein [Candidatus Saccharimonadales bacterium]